MAPWSRATTKAASLALLAALGCLIAVASDLTDARSGVVIRTEVSTHTFPASWRGGEIAATARPLADGEVVRSQRLAQEALSKYPPSLLAKNLRCVQFVGEMRFYDLAYGGTNSRDTVYVANGGAQSGFDDRFLLATIHHELSSILLRNHAGAFDEAAWTGANAEGFRYGNGGTQALRDGTANTAYRAELHGTGFLNQYSMSSVEEDFNTFAEALFSGDRRLWSVAEKFPRIAKKLNGTIAFYHALDPSLDEAFFLALAKE